MRMVIPVVFAIACGPCASAATTPSFKDFPVEQVFKGKAALVDFSSNAGAKIFKTRIIQGAKKGPNFAGEITVIEIGCGTECLMAQFVSARTGKLFESITTCGHLEYRLDSRLLVADPPVSGVKPTSGCEARYFHWTDSGVRRIR